MAYDAFVDERVQQTRDAVKATDLATAGATLLAGGLAFVLVAALAEHWLAPAGFRPGERYGVFAVGLIGAIAYVGTTVAPILARRVNPLYAAREIERDAPGLKNGLVNLLQLRDAGEAAPAPVRETLERQAAERLASTPRPAPDRTSLVRALRVALAIAAVIGVYVIVSPKDFFASAARVAVPWAEIDAPTRVRIGSVEPGSVEVAQGDRVEVSAIVTGLRDGERAYLVYSTADGAVADARVPMRASETGFGHTASLPPAGSPGETLGLQTDVAYRLEAGDARTSTARVTVVTAPTMAPVSVRYDYPAYTGYRDRTDEGVADLRAIAGTRVTITAEANLPIESAEIDLGADGRPDARMTIDGTTASGAVKLREGVDRYVLRFATTDGRSSVDPPRYAVEVIADLPPEVSIVEPAEPLREAAVNDSLTFVAEARDPDFRLSSVRLRGEATGRRDVRIDLLRGDGRGRVVGRTTTTPSRLGLKPGDEFAYWFEATDNRDPKPQVARTERQTIRVVGPRRAERGEQGERQPGDRSEQPGREPGEPSSQSGDEAAQGGDGAGEVGGDRSSADRSPGNQSAGEQAASDQQQADGTRPGDEQPPREQNERGDSAPPPEGAQGSRDSSDPGANQSDPAGSGGQSAERSPDGGDSPSSAGGDRATDPSGDSGPQDGGTAGGEEASGGDDAAGSDEPVPSDGGDDGEAFDRLREYLEERRSRGDGEEGSAAGRERSTGDRSPQPGDAVEQDQSGERGGEASDPRETVDAPAGQSGDDRNGQPGDSGQAQPGAEGAERTVDPAASEQADRPRGDGPGEQDRRGGQSDSTSSESGGDTPPGSPADPGTGPREGTGSSGENQAADRGSGRSGDRGAGEETGRAGEQGESDRPTDRSGQNRAGEGAASRPSESGDRSGQGDPAERSGERSPGDANQPQGEDSAVGGEGASDRGGEGTSGQPSDAIEDGRAAGGDQRPQGDPRDGGAAGQPSGGDGGGAVTGEGASPGGDAANLDYARKQTELVLEQLEEQLRRQEVDPEMLDRLGWTDEDLRRFVERWRGLQRGAARPGRGSSELDRRLRGLGLTPSGDRRQGVAAEDNLRDLRETIRVGPPPALRDELRDYRRSLNAGGDGGP